ncbi:MAG TPA: hypothetical protein VEX13_16710 [Chloroflexia bacterium]|nr:hypothetical protein [Chloroflexia bacterium]
MKKEKGKASRAEPTKEHLQYLARLERITRKTEKPLRGRLRKGRLLIISEHFSVPERLDKWFYDNIRVAIESEFQEKLEEYIEFAGELPPQAALDNLYLRLNIYHSREFCRELITQLKWDDSFRQMDHVDTEDISEMLGAIMDKCSETGLSWPTLARRWASEQPQLSKTDLEIFRVSLRGQSPAAIKVTLGLAESPEQIAEIILALRFSLIAYLQAAYVSRVQRQRKQRQR